MEFNDSKNKIEDNINLSLYPVAEIQTNEKTESKQNLNNNLFNNSSIMEFIKIFSLLKSKKLDINSILSSKIGKNLSSLENMPEILSLFKNTDKNSKSEEKLPKIDSLERIN